MGNNIDDKADEVVIEITDKLESNAYVNVQQYTRIKLAEIGKIDPLTASEIHASRVDYDEHLRGRD